MDADNDEVISLVVNAASTIQIDTSLLTFPKNYYTVQFDVTFPAAAGPAEEKAYVDRRGLYFILSQIISNAVKYSGEDPTLEISFSRSGYELMLRIRNSGMGVRSCDLPHIFDRFYKADKSRGRDKTGAGLGLYIAKTIMDAHAEELTVDSREGEFCAFSFTVQRSEA